MDLTVTDELLKLVKEEIRVTWSYEDERIRRMIRNAMARLQSIVGPVSFNLDAVDLISIQAIDLLCQRVRYDRNGVLSVFETDYHSDILSLQMQVAIERRC